LTTQQPLAGWNLYLIGGQTKERRLFDAFFFIRPPELLV